MRKEKAVRKAMTSSAMLTLGERVDERGQTVDGGVGSEGGEIGSGL